MENITSRIQAESSFGVYMVTELKMKITPQEHGWVELKTMFTEQCEQDLERMNADNICIKENNTILFCGVISDIRIKKWAGKEEICIQAYTPTIRMDVVKRSRSFQEDGLTYEQLFRKIVREYDGDFMLEMKYRKESCGLLIQYEETDWEFIKRVASKIGLPLVADVYGDTPRIYIGIPKLFDKQENQLEYKMRKDLNRYRLIEAELGMQMEVYHAGYQMESREDYQVGMNVNYGEKELTITRKWVESEKGELKKEYCLQKRESCVVIPYSCEKMIGLGLRGKVLDVKEDKVKVWFEMDKEQEKDKAVWFDVATTYFNGEEGIYIMPEKEETVLIFIPDGREETAYVRGVNHRREERKQEEKDPEIKYFKTAENKEWIISPEKLELISNSGKLYLSVGETGIEIESNQDIKIKSASTIILTGRKILLTAKKELCVKAIGSSLILNNITHLKGKKIKQTGLKKW